MEEDQLLRLTGLAYDAALGEVGWSDLAAAMQSLVDGQTAALWVHDPRLGALDILHAAPMPESAVQAYGEYYHAKDIWVASFLEASRRGHGGSQALCGAEFIGDDVFRQSEIYTDFYRGLGLFHVVGGVIPMGEAGTLSIGIHRPEQAGAFQPAQQQALSRLLPHLRRALQLRHRLKGGATAPFFSLDLLPMPAMAVDAAQRLLHANPAARDLLAAGQALRLERAGGPVAPPLVTAAHRQERPALRQMIRAVALGQLASGATRLTTEAGAAMAALAIPMPARWSEGQAPQRPGRVLLLLRDLGLAAPPVQLLRDLFGLSQAEAEIAASLVGGASAEEVAARRGVSVATVRSQIRVIMTKSGAASLRDLERLLALLRT